MMSNLYEIERAAARGAAVITAYYRSASRNYSGFEDDATAGTDIIADVLVYLCTEYGRECAYAVQDSATQHYLHETKDQP